MSIEPEASAAMTLAPEFELAPFDFGAERLLVAAVDDLRLRRTRVALIADA